MHKKRPDLDELFDEMTDAQAIADTEADEPEEYGPAQDGSEEENPFLEAALALAEMEQNGTLPEDFDLSEAVQDPAFATLLNSFEPEAAVRIYAAESRAEAAEMNAREQMSNAVRMRSALPKQTRSDRAVAPAPDYMAMSDEAFRALEQQYRNAARSGKRVHI